MNFFDEARSIRTMLDMRGLKQEQLATLLGVSQPYIANKLRLLKFSPEHQERIVRARLTERHARCLLRLDEKGRDEAIDKIERGGLTTAESEALVDRMCEQRRCEGVEFFSPTLTLHKLEDEIERALRVLRTFGISASSKREQVLGKTVISIAIAN